MARFTSLGLHDDLDNVSNIDFSQKRMPERWNNDELVVIDIIRHNYVAQSTHAVRCNIYN